MYQNSSASAYQLYMRVLGAAMSPLIIETDCMTASTSTELYTQPLKSLSPFNSPDTGPYAPVPSSKVETEPILIDLGACGPCLNE